MELREYTLDELLSYEQPTRYIVESTKYDDSYATPVLTAGKSFILGYTNETEGIFEKERLPVIIFDDFTTASQYVNFPFKVKSSAMKILNVNTELVLPKYIYYRMQIIQIDHDTHKRYWIQHYSKIKVQIPSIEEQAKVVDKIEEKFSQIDDGIETLKKTLSQLRIYREAVLSHTFSDMEGSHKCELGDVIEILTDYHSNGSYETLKEHVTLLDKPSYAIMIRSTNFENNDFKKDLKYIDENAYNFLKKSQLHGGEILMGKIGNAGRVYYMKKMDKPTSLAMNMFAMRFVEDVDSEYVYYYLKSPKAAADIKQYVKGVGTPTIDKKSVRSILFAYPSLGEQKKIVEDIKSKLSICEELEKSVELALAQADALKFSVLKKAFEGGVV